jgi:hypothetical protein
MRLLNAWSKLIGSSTWPLTVLTCQASAAFGARATRAFLSGKKVQIFGKSKGFFFPSLIHSTITYCSHGENQEEG